MAIHEIDVTPTWDTASRIYLEVLHNNDWSSDSSKLAREGIQEMAQLLDKAHQWIQKYTKENK